ncbi:MAG: hypothetical protein EPO24_08855, partial [Bacteroidetes bacterium]
MLAMLKKILKIIGYALGIVFLLLFLLSIFSQTQYFKDTLRPIIIAQLSKSINGTVHIGKIRGNFFNTLSVDSLSIFYGNDPVFSIGRVSVSYDPISLFKSTIIIDTLSLEAPRVSLLKLNDSSWNVDKLFKPATDTSTGKFDKTIVLKAFTLRNGILSLHDSLHYQNNDTATHDFQRVDYHNFDVTNLDIFLSAVIKDKDIKTNITAIRFISLAPRFVLESFRGDFSVDTSGIIAEDVSIKTANSEISFSAQLSKENIFDGFYLPALEHNTTTLEFDAERIDFAELKQFLPELQFLSGTASLDIDVEGEFGNLAIKRLNLDTYSTSIKIAGHLKNLHKPDSLYIMATIGDSKLFPSDAHHLMPTFNLPPLEDVGQTSFYGQFIGYPTNFQPSISIKGAVGAVDARGSIRIPNDTLQYNLNFSTQGLDLSKIFSNTALKSFITTRGNISGKGTTLATLHSNLNLDVDSVQIDNFIIDHSKITVNALPNALESVSLLNVNGATVNINAKLNNADSERPEFASQLAVSSFDINKFFPSAGIESKIDASAIVKGSGKEIDRLNISSTISLFESRINSYRTDTEELSIILNQSTPAEKRFSVKSSVADFEMNGDFDFHLLTSALPRHISMLVSRIANHTSAQDSTTKQHIDKTVIQPLHPGEQLSMDFHYIIEAKNLKPISSIIGKTPFNGRGKIQGAITGADSLLNLSAKGTIEEIQLGEADSGIYFNNSAIDIDAHNLTSRQTLEKLSSDIVVSTQSGSVRGTNIHNGSVSLHYRDSKGNFDCSGIIDSILIVKTIGIVSMQPQTYVFDADTFNLVYRNYEWKNDNDVQIRLNRDGVRILHALMKHKDESVYLAGTLNANGQFDATSTIRNLDILNFSHWLLRVNTEESNVKLTGKVSADIKISGTPESPTLSLLANCRKIVYRNIKIGTIAATFDYDKQTATIVANVSPSENDSIRTLTITGILPINLAFQGVNTRFLDQEQNFRIVSHGFSLALLEQIIPQMKNLTGTFSGEILMTGTPRHPLYMGRLTIEDAQFIFSSNNVAYKLAGTIEPLGERLQFRSMRMTNVTDQKYDGNATINGYLTLKEFELTDYDITTKGSVLIMSDSTRRVVPQMYGPLLAETDSSGVRLQGTVDSPFLSGNLYVQDANIVFPPTRNVNNRESELTLVYVYLDDTTKKIMITDSSQQKQDNPVPGQNLTSNFGRQPTGVRQSFIDLLRYDLNIETRGPTRTRMIFTPATSEELYAELEGSVRAVNDRGTANIYGEISVTDRSYYYFLKKFDARGTLRFIGPWDNPELNVIATYQGTRTITSPGSEETQQQKVIVQIDISGTRYEPRPELSLKVQNENSPVVNWSTQAKVVDA